MTPLFFVHGAYTGSWMWSKYTPHFVEAGYDCYAINLRSHYKSKSVDISMISFNDYLEDVLEGLAEAKHLSGDYASFQGMSHAGLLIGIRYQEVVNRILGWLEMIE